MFELVTSVVIQSAIVVLPVLLGVAYLTWLERKVAGFIQVRLGPQHVGYRGLLQPIADGIKLILKENVTPLAARASPIPQRTRSSTGAATGRP